MEPAKRRSYELLIPDLVDGGYTVTVPTLPSCVTERDTLSEALDHARDAIRLFVADLEAEGEAVPEEAISLNLAIVGA